MGLTVDYEELGRYVTDLMSAAQLYLEASEKADEVRRIFENAEVYTGKASGKMDLFATSLQNHLVTLAKLSAKGSQFVGRVILEHILNDSQMAALVNSGK
jgi:hypothetical protein